MNCLWLFMLLAVVYHRFPSLDNVTIGQNYAGSLSLRPWSTRGKEDISIVLYIQKQQTKLPRVT